MILDKLKINLNKKDKAEDSTEEGEIEVTIQLPSSKIVKARLSKILSSRKDVYKKYEEVNNLIRETFTLFLRSKLPKLGEKELSYEEIKKEINALDQELEKEISKENACAFLDRLIELSYAPYEYSNNPKEHKEEIKKQLQYISEHFKALLW